MWRRWLAVTFSAAILLIAFLSFFSSLPSAPDVARDLLSAVNDMILPKEPKLINVKIRLSETPIDNNMRQIPLKGIEVELGGRREVTDERGVAFFHIPKGNHSLTVIRAKGIWRSFLDVKSDTEVEIIFKVYKITAEEIKVEAEAFNPFTRVFLRFNLPEGRYYLGTPVISYYTPWGELKRYGADRLVMNYSIVRVGGGHVQFVEEVRGMAVYIIPQETYILAEEVGVKLR